MEQKKYHSIVRMGHRSTRKVFNVGDQITIQEKIDGANASFMRDGDKVLAFSRANLLGEGLTLNGFYGWVQINIDPKSLLEGVVYFGEWSGSHKINYGENSKKFFLYDIYNTFTSEYVYFSIVKDEAKRLNLNLVPLFYEGEYQSYEHLEEFIGRTDLGGKIGDVESGEGIVVKNVNYKDHNGEQVFVKLVIDRFREIQKQKAPKDPNLPETVEGSWVTQNMTKARVEKHLYKLVDDGIISEEFGLRDMSTILRNINRNLIEDLLKEESESLPEGYEQKEIGRAVSAKSPTIIKEIIQERQV